MTKKEQERKLDTWEARRKSHSHGKNEFGVPVPCGFDSCGYWESSTWYGLPNITWRMYLKEMVEGDTISSAAGRPAVDSDRVDGVLDAVRQ